MVFAKTMARRLKRAVVALADGSKPAHSVHSRMALARAGSLAWVWALAVGFLTRDSPPTAYYSSITRLIQFGIELAIAMG